jgi:hypothetical protein
MNTAIERETIAVREALVAPNPRYALRDNVKYALGDLLLTPDALIGVLDQLADEYRRAGMREAVSNIVEILDVLEGQASDAAAESFFEGVPWAQIALCRRVRDLGGSSGSPTSLSPA